MSQPEQPEHSEEETALADAQNAASLQARQAIKAEKRDEDEYRLQQALKVETTSGDVYGSNIVWCGLDTSFFFKFRVLTRWLHSGDVNLEPEYQRDVVWTKEKQTGLIDSILKKFYIPPIIFVVSTDDDGNETKTCIDGKQRLTSIYRFMDGLILHRTQSQTKNSGTKSTLQFTAARKSQLPVFYLDG
ncbi:hypothetical protein D9758_016899 [Tetrapyrgos nigripes]|uniref:GmrSD restriction endonucleases N-terminal domain-containing protein n=1 Tax=Tetrapyrgos nigripes TaxID=182062 RepID=A0A8H5C4B2_9AGAR|nr:hypothetical protein D9758_016899 [Tetrapyrgos nigripes]